jgi:hypothetical protein
MRWLVGQCPKAAGRAALGRNVGMQEAKVRRVRAVGRDVLADGIWHTAKYRPMASTVDILNEERLVAPAGAIDGGQCVYPEGGRSG